MLVLPGLNLPLTIFNRTMKLLQNELSDQQLLNAFRTGNLKAYDLLFDRFSKRLYNYGVKYLGNEELAEEKMMDVMVWIWENRQAIPEDVNFESYIFRAMKNAAAMEIRKRILQTLPLNEAGLIENMDSLKADSQLICYEISASYVKGLNALSPQRRKAYMLSREEGLSHADIAKELNISLNTVKNHVKAALAHFRSHMEEFTNSTIIFLIIFFLKY